MMSTDNLSLPGHSEQISSGIIKAYSRSLFESSNSLSLAKEEKKFNTLNSRSFRIMLQYITSLRNDGIIGDNVLQKLIEHACAIFIENKIEQTVGKAFKRFPDIFGGNL